MSDVKFNFSFYRFVGNEGHRTTEIVRDFNQADGMRSLVDKDPNVITTAIQRVSDWATSKGLTANSQEPYPSEKYPGKVWLEFRFNGLTL